MHVTADMILERAEEAEKLWDELYIPPIQYDLSKWGSAFQQYPVKDYPKVLSPKAQRPTAQKQQKQKKSEDGKTSHK